MSNVSCIQYSCRYRLKQDRERQERLARERLAARRQKQQSDLDKAKEDLKSMENDENPVEVADNSNIAQLQVINVIVSLIAHMCVSCVTWKKLLHPRIQPET